MKNKKGILMLMMPILIVMFLILAIVILLIIFSGRISETLNSTVAFFQSYGIWILILVGAIIFRNQIRAILNFALGKVGVKV